MSLAEELETLSGWIHRIPRVGMDTLRGAGVSMHLLDFVMIGALKRTLSLASGLHAILVARNMVCARALLRMQLDTVTRFLAYTYVSDPESVAHGVIAGTQLRKFKSTDGKPLTDSYPGLHRRDRVSGYQVLLTTRSEMPGRRWQSVIDSLSIL